jgi:hypothetical protein
MAEKYFKKDGVPFMVSMVTYQVYMLIGDCWVRISDQRIRTAIRLQSTEIPRAAAMALTVKNQFTGMPPAETASGDKGTDRAAAWGHLNGYPAHLPMTYSNCPGPSGSSDSLSDRTQKREINLGSRSSRATSPSSSSNS